MGLLDDAIREHLELKRRHGADPGELDQQAKDALGPPRREAAPAAEPDEPVARRPLEDEPPRARRGAELGDHWPEDEEDDDLPPAPARPARRPEAPRGGSIRADAPAPATPRPPRHDDDEAPLADPERTRAFSLEEERAATEQPPAPPARPHRRIDAPDEDASADELERTPEFLEDTPEHDRLWFEQRPPKDFDF